MLGCNNQMENYRRCKYIYSMYHLENVDPQNLCFVCAWGFCMCIGCLHSMGRGRCKSRLSHEARNLKGVTHKRILGAYLIIALNVC